MKKVLLLSALCCIALPVQAQVCNSTAKSSLRDCVVDNTNRCEAETSACNIFEHSYTMEDVENDAIERCCDKTSGNSKKAKVKRKKCLKRARRNFNSRSAKALPREYRTEAKEVIDNLIDTDCYGDSYTALF